MSNNHLTILSNSKFSSESTLFKILLVMMAFETIRIAAGQYFCQFHDPAASPNTFLYIFGLARIGLIALWFARLSAY